MRWVLLSHFARERGPCFITVTQADRPQRRTAGIRAPPHSRRFVGTSENNPTGLVPSLTAERTGNCREIALVLKKSPSWCLRGRQQQGYKQTRVSDAAGNRHSRRLAAYDGATRPFGVAVLLLPHRRSGSSKPLVTFHRPLRQFRFCA